MTGANIAAYQNKIASHTRTRRIALWGQYQRCTPALVSQVFGDGLQLFWWEPIGSRPTYYVIRGDSSWVESHSDEGDHFSEHLDEIADAIMDEFGAERDEYEDVLGRHRVKHHDFPALADYSCSCWGSFGIFTRV